MARKRMIDPNFWTDEKLGTCEPLARMTFMGLISQADDAGRLNGHPALIKSQVFPYDYDITPDQVNKWLDQLEQKGLIRRYEVDGQSYIYIPKFLKHQKINRPSDSKLPPPPPDDAPKKTFTEDSLNTHGDFNEPSTRREEKRKEEKRKETTASKITESTIEDQGANDNGLVIDDAADELKPAESDDWLSDDLTEEQKAEMKKVTDHWRRKRAILVIPPADLEAMEELVKKGIPAADIIKGIDKTFADFAERNRSKPWKKINSFRYCLQTIYEIHQARTTGGNVRPFLGRSPEPARPNVIDEGALEKYRAMMERAKRKTQTGG